MLRCPSGQASIRCPSITCKRQRQLPYWVRWRHRPVWSWEYFTCLNILNIDYFLALVATVIIIDRECLRVLTSASQWAFHVNFIQPQCGWNLDFLVFWRYADPNEQFANVHLLKGASSRDLLLWAEIGHCRGLMPLPSWMNDFPAHVSQVKVGHWQKHLHVLQLWKCLMSVRCLKRTCVISMEISSHCNSKKYDSIVRFKSSGANYTSTFINSLSFRGRNRWEYLH